MESKNGIMPSGSNINECADVATKRKRRKSATRPDRTALNPEVLGARAQQALDEGRFRGAIADFKVLLKSAERGEWREGLATAYLGRARELAAKGMLKEALAIGEVRRQLCSEAPLDPEHLGLLLRSGQTAEAVRLYRQAEQSLDRQTLAGMRCRLAALYLSGVSGLEDGLPPDDPVVAHGAPARAALDAWCRGDDEAAAQALAGIPFRSPYKDWVQILKALIKASADTFAAQALLQRVPDDSAFAPLAGAAGLALLPESAFPDALAQTGEAAQRFAAVLRGWSQDRMKLWAELRHAGVAAQGLARIMDRHRKVLGEEWVRHHGLRLLVDDFPRSLKGSPVLGGRRLTLFEQDLVEAWVAEEEGDPWNILDIWRDVIQRLHHPSPPPPGSDDALRIALIQRRLDTRWHLLDRPVDPHVSEQLAPAAQIQLEESLFFDPDDLPTHIRLIAYHRARNRLRDARRLLDLALTRWPGDVDLLGEALETAVAGGAFKKAAGFARRVLKLDPINTRARNNLLESHLSHARKQLLKGRTDLAERELELAAQWAQGEKAEVRLGLLRGFLALDGDRQSGEAQLRALVTRLGDGIRGQLALALEAVRLGRVLGTFMKRLGLPRIKQPQREDLLGFLRDLREQLDTGNEIPREIPAFFEPALKRAAGLKLAQQECEAACETLRRCGLHQARSAHARAALKRWPGLPVFELHAFEAKHAGRYWTTGAADITQLENALIQARNDGDTRTAHRIGELLEQVAFMPPLGPRIPAGFPEEPPSEEPPPELLDMVEDIGIEGVLDLMHSMGGMDPQMKEMEGLLGREQMVEIIEAMLNGADPDEIPIDFGPILPRKPRRRGKPRSQPSAKSAAPKK